MTLDSWLCWSMDCVVVVMCSLLCSIASPTLLKGRCAGVAVAPISWGAADAAMHSTEPNCMFILAPSKCTCNLCKKWRVHSTLHQFVCSSIEHREWIISTLTWRLLPSTDSYRPRCDLHQQQQQKRAWNKRQRQHSKNEHTWRFMAEIVPADIAA